VDSIGAGTYSVEITDSLGCTATATAIVGEATDLSLSILSSSNVTCNGGKDGAATAQGTGGTAPLSYVWSDALGQTAATALNLSAGTYYVQVVDLNKCVATDSVVITEPAATSANATITDVSCYGQADGSIEITAANISTYEWSTGMVNVNPHENLAAGTYTVTLTTGLGCTAAFSYTIEESDSLEASIQLLSPVTCNNSNNAVLKVNTVGGKPNFSYSWNGGAASNKKILNKAGAGVYTVLVTDKNGCTATANYNLVEPSLLTIESEGTGVKCAENSDGQLVVTGSGGSLLSGNYEYSVDSVNWQTGNIFADLKSGIYTVYVRDDNGCIGSQASTVESADPFFLTSFNQDTTIEYADTLKLVAGLSDLDSVKYSWSSDLGGLLTDSSLTYTLTPEEAGIYYFHAENPNGCMIDSLVKVEVTKPRRANAPMAFTPNGDGRNDTFFIQGEKKVASINMFRVYDRWGNLVYEGTGLEVNDGSTGWDGTYKGKPMNSGIYAWYAEVEFVDGHVEVLKGDITLMR
ncbi:MAG: T9SS type B sorting domain-containing protein, partial [Aureispira sp.]|nr:T9SS type B sorting domain-containing protein [Aureispira sp.]